MELAALYQRMVLWTMSRHKLIAADAEEVVQEAIAQLIKAGEFPENVDQGLARAVGSRVNGLVNNRRRKKAAVAVGLTHDGEPAEPELPADPEAQIIKRDQAQKAIGMVMERASHDSLVTDMLLLQADGIDDPKEMAAHLLIDVREVYNARRRLRALHASVREELGER